jgi:hypothetical protein
MAGSTSNDHELILFLEACAERESDPVRCDQVLTLLEERQQSPVPSAELTYRMREMADAYAAALRPPVRAEPVPAWMAQSPVPGRGGRHRRS